MKARELIEQLMLHPLDDEVRVAISVEKDTIDFKIDGVERCNNGDGRPRLVLRTETIQIKAKFELMG